MAATARSHHDKLAPGPVGSMVLSESVATISVTLMPQSMLLATNFSAGSATRAKKAVRALHEMLVRR